MSKLTDEEIERMRSMLMDGSGAVVGSHMSAMVYDGLTELRSLRALLATPCEWSRVETENGPRGPRIVFSFAGEQHGTNPDRALALGAAMIRAALEARGEK